MVKTSPFHGGNMGSNPVGVTTSWGYSSAGRARALQARGHRFEPCCPHHIKKRATLCVVLFLCVGKQHRTRIRRFLRLCALRAPLCPGHTARSLRNASISASLLTSPVVPTTLKNAQHYVLCFFYVSGNNIGREPNRTVGVRQLLANACVMHRV